MRVLLFILGFSLSSGAFANVEQITFELRQVFPLTADAGPDSALFEFLLPSTNSGASAEIDLSVSEIEIDQQINQVVAIKSWRPDIRKQLIVKQVYLCKEKGLEICKIGYGIRAHPATLSQIYSVDMLATSENNMMEMFDLPVLDYFKNEIEESSGLDEINKRLSFFKENQKLLPYFFLHKETGQLISDAVFTHKGFARENRSNTSTSKSAIVSGDTQLLYMSVGLFVSKEVLKFKHNDECHLYDDQMSPIESDKMLTCLKETTYYLDGAVLLQKHLKYILENASVISRIEFNVKGGVTSGLEFSSVVTETDKILANELLLAIRDNQITTSVRDGAICGSLCTMLYQAGANREASSGATFFYHGIIKQKLGWESCLAKKSEYECKQEMNDDLVGLYSKLWEFDASSNFVMDILRSVKPEFELENGYVNPTGVDEFFFKNEELQQLVEARVITNLN